MGHQENLWQITSVAVGAKNPLLGGVGVGSPPGRGIRFPDYPLVSRPQYGSNLGWRKYPPEEHRD